MVGAELHIASDNLVVVRFLSFVLKKPAMTLDPRLLPETSESMP